MATLEELVQGRPWNARILYAYGLDPAGTQSLQQACQAQQVNQAELTRHLEQVWEGPQALQRLTVGQLLDYIVHCHHRYLRKALPQLLAQARVLTQSDPRYESILNELWELNNEANPHMFREEMEVFPAILDMQGDLRRAPHLPRWIQRLEQEHSRALQHFLAFRRALEMPDHNPEARRLMAGLADLDEDMRWHMYAENDLVFASLRLPA